MNEQTKWQTRRRYDDIYRRHAVELTLQGGRTVKQVAQDLGIALSILYRWRREVAAEGVSSSAGRRTIEQLEAENQQLRTELGQMQQREIVLKKSLGILSETPGSGMPKSRH
jgi:transposase-like protein